MFMWIKVASLLLNTVASFSIIKRHSTDDVAIAFITCFNNNIFLSQTMETFKKAAQLRKYSPKLLENRIIIINNYHLLNNRIV